MTSKFPSPGLLHYTSLMHPSTYEAFFNELDSIYSLEKGAGKLKDVISFGAKKVKNVAGKIDSLDRNAGIWADIKLRNTIGIDAMKARKVIVGVTPSQYYAGV